MKYDPLCPDCRLSEPVLAVWVILLNLGLQLLDSLVFSPLILGKSLGLGL